VALLRGGSDEGRADAVRALYTLAAADDANRAAIIEAGALRPLLELVCGHYFCLLAWGRGDAELALEQTMPDNKNVVDMLPLVVELLSGDKDDGAPERSSANKRVVPPTVDEHLRRRLVEEGMLPLLMTLMSSGSDTGGRLAIASLASVGARAMTAPTPPP
jgi:hypothetical protein